MVLRWQRDFLITDMTLESNRRRSNILKFCLTVFLNGDVSFGTMVAYDQGQIYSTMIVYGV